MTVKRRVIAAAVAAAVSSSSLILLHRYLRRHRGGEDPVQQALRVRVRNRNYRLPINYEPRQFDLDDYSETNAREFFRYLGLVYSK